MDDLPVVLLHGFTQTGASWAPLRRHLPASWRVHAPDLPGHGSAGSVRADLAESARRLASDLAEPAVVVGYSMGGRTAVRLALDHGTRVAAMVLLGATAGIDGADDRRARRDADERLARQIEAEGTATFLRAWLAQPLFAGLEIDPDDRRAREANPPDGLAASLRLCGTGTMDPPWWPELGAIACPTLVVWGEHDPKFAGLGRRLAAAMGPHATTAEVPGAGHAVHLQQPGAVADLLVRFVEQLRGARPGRP